MRGSVAAVAVLVTLAAWPAASSAAEQTFCVADPDCSGTPEASVANALAAAKLSKANRRLVAVHRRVRVGARAAVHDQVGNSRVAKSRFKLRAPARRS